LRGAHSIENRHDGLRFSAHCCFLCIWSIGLHHALDAIAQVTFSALYLAVLTEQKAENALGRYVPGLFAV